MKADTSKGSFWNSFAKINETLGTWIQTSEVLLVFGKLKKADPTKIKWKK